MRGIGCGVLVALGLLAAVPARAESPVLWQLEFKFGPYKAGVDDEFGGDQKPFQTIYGDSSVLMGMFELDIQFWRDVGSLAVGGSIGYAMDEGTSLSADGTKPGDETTFNVLPLQLSLVYHFDYLATRFEIPFVPFVKVGLDYWIWWIRDANDDISETEDGEGFGGTFGWHVSGGVKFLLDWLDPTSASTFDLELGVNNSYLFAEFVLARVDDFGSNESFRLGDEIFLFGLAFEF